jgi:hypothetical protein
MDFYILRGHNIDDLLKVISNPNKRMLYLQIANNYIENERKQAAAAHRKH